MPLHCQRKKKRKRKEKSKKRNIKSRKIKKKKRKMLVFKCTIKIQATLAHNKLESPICLI